MANTARNLDVNSHMNGSDAAPESRDQKRLEVPTMDQVGNNNAFEDPGKLVREWETTAAQDIHTSSDVAMAYAKEHGEVDIANRIVSDQQDAVGRLTTLGEKARRVVSPFQAPQPSEAGQVFMGGADSPQVMEARLPEPAEPKKPIRIVSVPETFEDRDGVSGTVIENIPEVSLSSPEDVEVYQEQKDAKQAELKALQKMKPEDRTEKDKLRISILGTEVKMMEANLRKHELANDISLYEEEKGLLQRDLNDLLAASLPANDIENAKFSSALKEKSEENRMDAMIRLLPADQDHMGRAVAFWNRIRELQGSISERKMRIAEAGTILVALDHLLRKDTNQLQGIEKTETEASEKAAADARERAEATRRRSEEAARLAEERRKEEERKNAPLKFLKSGAGAFLAGVGAGIFGMKPMMKVGEWIANGADWVLGRFEKLNAYQTIQDIMSLPRRAMDWLSGKPGGKKDPS